MELAASFVEHFSYQMIASESAIAIFLAKVYCHCRSKESVEYFSCYLKHDDKNSTGKTQQLQLHTIQFACIRIGEAWQYTRKFCNMVLSQQYLSCGKIHGHEFAVCIIKMYALQSFMGKSLSSFSIELIWCQLLVIIISPMSLKKCTQEHSMFQWFIFVPVLLRKKVISHTAIFT